jgi:DNA-directed RNA polymerase subunit H
MMVELMSTQGYDISEYQDGSLTETNAKYTNEQLDMLFDKSRNTDGPVVGTGDESIHKTYVNYHIDKALRPAHIHEVIDDLFHVGEVLTKNDTLIIVAKDDPHDTLINTSKHLWEKEGYFVVIQSIKRLQFNILNHSLVPPHRIISQEEQDIMTKKYNIDSLVQIPDISRFDPVAIAIGIRPGQVCEIVRPSKTSITGTYYRVCV